MAAFDIGPFDGNDIGAVETLSGTAHALASALTGVGAVVSDLATGAVELSCSLAGSGYVVAEPVQRYISVQAGSSLLTDTWDRPGIPGPLDIIRVAHAVHTPTGFSQTVGFSPDATHPLWAIEIENGGTLTVQDNASVFSRGKAIVRNGGALIVGEGVVGGAVLEFDASAATGTQEYPLQISDAHTTGAQFRIHGTVANPAIVRSNASGGNAYVDDGSFINGGEFDPEDAKLIRFGTATRDAVTNYHGGNGTRGMLRMVRTERDSCGRIRNRTNGSGAQIIDIRECNSHDGTHADDLEIRCAVAITTGTRNLQDNYFSGRVNFLSQHDIDCQRNVFDGSIGSLTAASVGRFAVWKDIFVRKTVQNAWVGIQAAIVERTIFIVDGAIANPHFLKTDTANNQTLQDLVFELTGSDENGDCILIESPSGTITTTIDRVIALKNHSGGVSGTIVSSLGNANAFYSLNHGTFFVKGELGAHSVAESYTGHPDMCSSSESHVVLSVDGTGWGIADSGGPDVVANYFTNVGYSAFETMTDKYEGGDAWAAFRNAPTNDQTSLDPLLVNKNANIKTWDTSLGGDGSVTNARAELAKLNLSTHDANYTVVAYFEYIQQQFTPLEPTLTGSAHDGGDKGAVAVSALASITGSGLINATLDTLPPGELAASATGRAFVAADLAGAKPFAASITGTSSLAAEAQATKPASAVLNGSGLLVSEAQATKPASATLQGTGLLVSDLGLVGVADLSSSLSASGGLVSNLTRTGHRPPLDRQYTITRAARRFVIDEVTNG